MNLKKILFAVVFATAALFTVNAQVGEEVTFAEGDTVTVPGNVIGKLGYELLDSSTLIVTFEDGISFTVKGDFNEAESFVGVVTDSKTLIDQTKELFDEATKDDPRTLMEWIFAILGVVLAASANGTLASLITTATRTWKGLKVIFDGFPDNRTIAQLVATVAAGIWLYIETGSFAEFTIEAYAGRAFLTWIASTVIYDRFLRKVKKTPKIEERTDLEDKTESADA